MFKGDSQHYGAETDLLSHGRVSKSTSGAVNKVQLLSASVKLDDENCKKCSSRIVVQVDKQMLSQG